MFERYRRSRLSSRPVGYLWADAAAAGGDPAAAAAAAAAGGDPAAAAAAAAAGGGPAAAAAAEKTYSFKEDRSNWVDPVKHKAAETAVNRTATEIATLRSQLAESNKRVAALSGVNPPDPETAEADKIAQAFFALPQFAHLKGVTPELLDQVKQLVSEGASITAARDHVWNQHTDRFLSDLDTEFAAEIGTEQLTPGQQRKLHAAFDAMVPNERTDPEAFATFKKRFEQADPKLIAEFVKEYVSDIIEPARRLATVPIAQRRAVPRSGGSQSVVTQVPKPDYSKMSVAEMLEDAEKRSAEAGH